MGLDISHECWHGAYTAFMRWRQEIARAAGLPPLDLMEGFCERGHYSLYWIKDAPECIWNSLPIKWESLKPDPALYELLHHSDCEGEIAWEICGPLADRLTELLPLLKAGDVGGHIGDYRDKTQTFIDGLRRAYEAKENVDFH